MDANTLKSADLYARLGYAVFAVDMFGYGEGVLPKSIPEMTEQILIYRKDRALMRARAQAGFDALMRNPMVDASRIALIGYCFGGTVGVEIGLRRRAARRDDRDPRLVRRPRARRAKNVKGKVPDPARRRGQGLPRSPAVSTIIDELRSAKVPIPARALQRRRATASRRRKARPRSAQRQSIASTDADC